ncbi:MAG TPA: alpha/beta fold hydrolase [bacterium]|nr:alpha/beta fold hydrolase [bacterium]
MKNKNKKSPAKKVPWGKISAGVLGLVLAGFLVFVYGILPAKVAQGLVARSQVKKPLTLTPQTDGFKYQDAAFTASDGVRLKGWWLPSAKAGKPQGTVILSHGVFKNREQVLTRAEFLARAGYQVLLFDLRGCGESGDSPVSGGLLEARDYEAAYDYLGQTKRLREPVVFFGFSLGAIAALRAGQAEGDKIQAIIADSPLPNLKSYVSRRTAGGLFSACPGFLGRCLSDYNARTGLALSEKDLDLIPVVSAIDQTPVLYITGQKDDLARPEEVRKLFNATASHHRRLNYIPDAGHEQTYLLYPVVYERGVFEFLNDLKAGFPQPKLPG